MINKMHGKSLTKGKKSLPTVLCILDGWGEGTPGVHNAVSVADTPCFDDLKAHAPLALLEASGPAVGLPDGQMGNSEVGHMTLGSGRIALQDLLRIATGLASPSFGDNTVFQRFVSDLISSKGACHLLGLISRGGVHSNTDHLIQLCHHLNARKIPVWIHGFLDGRDTEPFVADQELAHFLEGIQGLDRIKIATLSGRYYAMDRDQRWDRIDLALDAMKAHGKESTLSPLESIQDAHKADVGDEFFKPVFFEGYPGFQEGDGVLAGNFRADRMRQILGRLAEEPLLKPGPKCGLSSYSSELDVHFDVLFPKPTLKETLGEVVSKAGLKQMRVAETEKYAHVSYFLNGGAEYPFDGEDRSMVPSPKVKTYDQKPEMAADLVTQKVCAALESGTYDLIVVNYANADMVGHTGDFKATVKAVEAVDQCLGRLKKSVKMAGGILAVTADHGNADLMLDPKSGAVLTAHSLNPVPFLIQGLDVGEKIKVGGGLSDVAPTLLEIMGLGIPAEMTGQSLLIP